MSQNPGRVSRRLKITSIVLAVFVVLLLVVLVFFVNPPGKPGDDVKVTIGSGMTGNVIATVLADEGVISNDQLFRAYVKFGHSYNAEAGEYVFKKNMSFGEAISVLNGGPAVEVTRISFPEGFRINQVADRIAARIPGHSSSEFLQTAASGEFDSDFVDLGDKDLEGFLFPDTYDIPKNSTDKQIIQMMLDRFDYIAEGQDLKEGAAAIGYTPAQVITVASLIEKEVKRPEDRAPAAGVIYNRLKINQPLQLDSTATYAAQEFGRATQLKDREVESAYNTFKNTGLPPTAIDSPGEAAIHAALHPTKHNYYYFITVNDCTNETVFTATYAEFNQAVARRRAENPASC